MVRLEAKHSLSRPRRQALLLSYESQTAGSTSRLLETASAQPLPPQLQAPVTPPPRENGPFALFGMRRHLRSASGSIVPPPSLDIPRTARSVRWLACCAHPS